MRSSAVLRATALVLTWAVTGSGPLAAQSPADSARREPYSELRIRLSGARILNREAIHDFWRPQTGGELAIATPFYVGSIGVGATLIPFRARDGQRPDFRALMLGLDWGAELPLRGPVRARAAARVGDFVMLIDNPDRWLDSESELFVGGELSAGLAVRGDFAVTVAGSLARVHTRPSLDIALLAVGLEYAARTPGWLRSFLE